MANRTCWLIRPAQPQPGVGGQHAVGIDEQRRHVQHRDLGEIDDQLADPHQRLRHRIAADRGSVAQRAREHRAGAATLDQAVGQCQVQRRQIDRSIGRIGRGAAAAERDRRPERRVVRHADRDLPRSADIALHQQLAGRTPPPGARGQQPGGGGDLCGVVQVEDEAAGRPIRRWRTVAQLHHRRIAKERGRVGGILDAGGEAGRHDRNAVGGQDVERLVLRQGQAARGARAGETATHPLPFGGQIEHRAGRQFAGGLAVAAVADEVLEGLDRLAGGGENRQAGMRQRGPVHRAGGFAHGGRPAAGRADRGAVGTGWRWSPRPPRLAGHGRSARRRCRAARRGRRRWLPGRRRRRG